MIDEEVIKKLYELSEMLEYSSILEYDIRNCCKRAGEKLSYKERGLKFIKSLRELCLKYQIGIVGTCDTEGILGEITLVDWNSKDLYREESEFISEIDHMGYIILRAKAKETE